MKTAISTILILLACSTVQAQQDKPELSDKQIRRQAAQLHRQMYKAFQRKDYAQAAEKCVQAEALDLPDPVRRHFLYNHACALARLGRKQQAMEKLTAAVEAGWQNLSHLQKDPDLDSLRKMKGYKQLIERLGRSAGPDVVQQENGRT
ncbi:MAG: TPR end-of-group domain-containing protein, partial [Planctomycetota bacterium]